MSPLRKVKVRLGAPPAWREPRVLDGDVLRQLLSPILGCSNHERDAYYEALVRLAAELASHGLTVRVAATAHGRAYRRRARQLAPPFHRGLDGDAAR